MPLELPSEQDRIFMLAKAYQLISIFFAHWQDADITPKELDDRFREFLPRVSSASSRLGLAKAMSEFISPLNNSHTMYMDRELLENTPDLGFRARLLDGEWVVTSSSVQDLRPGDAILTVQGRSLDEWYADLRRYVCARQERSRRHLVMMWLALTLEDQPLEVRWLDKSQVERSANLSRPPSQVASSVSTQTEGKWLSDDIYYLRIPSFGQPRFEQRALELVELHAHASHMIIDVRGNTGGSTPLGLIRKLMHVPWRPSRYSTPAHVGLLEYLALHSTDYEDFEDLQLLWRPKNVQPEPGAYQGNLLILVDHLTGSAAEDFVIPFKDNGRALIIGEPTWGSTGQPYMQDFGDGITLFIGTKRDYMPDGSQIEGRGVEPDVRVEPTRQGLYLDRDLVLDRAVEILSGL